MIYMMCNILWETVCGKTARTGLRGVWPEMATSTSLKFKEINKEKILIKKLIHYMNKQVRMSFLLCKKRATNYTKKLCQSILKVK